MYGRCSKQAEVPGSDARRAAEDHPAEERHALGDGRNDRRRGLEAQMQLCLDEPLDLVADFVEPGAGVFE